MLEGILQTAGFEGNYYKATIIKDDGSAWKRDVPEVGVQTQCAQMIGKRVIAELTKNPTNKWFHISAIQLAGKAAPAPAGGDTPAYEKTDWGLIGLRKARCNVIQSACLLFQGNKTVTVDQILTAAKAFEDYVYTDTLVDVAKGLGGQIQK